MKDAQCLARRSRTGAALTISLLLTDPTRRVAASTPPMAAVPIIFCQLEVPTWKVSYFTLSLRNFLH